MGQEPARKEASSQTLESEEEPSPPVTVETTHLTVSQTQHAGTTSSATETTPTSCEDTPISSETTSNSYETTFSPPAALPVNPHKSSSRNDTTSAPVEEHGSGDTVGGKDSVTTVVETHGIAHTFYETIC